MPLTRGARLGPYEISGLIGAGGMGEVYRARDTRLGRDVAIKVIPEELAAHKDRLRRFEEEARATAALSHPNILALFDVGVEGDVHYIVEELLEGETLRERLRLGRLPVHEAVDCGVQIARGLAAAHERGIAHRDLKPENVFLTRDGRLKVLDFGLAKLRETKAVETEAPTATAATDAGTRLGTVGYMSPEQARGQELDARSDLFSFGAVLYEMATGKAAFYGNTSAVIFDSILNRQPLPLSHWSPDLPSAVNTTVLHALEKDRELRYQTAAELRAELRRLKRDLDSALPGSSLSSLQVPAPQTGSSRRLSAQGLPIVNRQPLRLLLGGLQLMYLVFYLIALGRLEPIQSLAQILIPGSGWSLPAVVLVTGGIGIAIRLYLLSSIVFDHPELGTKFRQLFPLLLLLDQLWALSPLLLVTHLGLGLAFGATAALLYCPFSQRALVRMAYPVAPR